MKHQLDCREWIERGDPNDVKIDAPRVELANILTSKGEVALAREEDFRC